MATAIMGKGGMRKVFLLGTTTVGKGVVPNQPPLKPAVTVRLPAAPTAADASRISCGFVPSVRYNPPVQAALRIAPVVSRSKRRGTAGQTGAVACLTECVAAGNLPADRQVGRLQDNSIVRRSEQ